MMGGVQKYQSKLVSKGPLPGYTRALIVGSKIFQGANHNVAKLDFDTKRRLLPDSRNYL